MASQLETTSGATASFFQKLVGNELFEPPQELLASLAAASLGRTELVGRERTAWLAANSGKADGFGIKACDGSVVLSWSVLERTGSSCPVSVKVDLTTGQIRCQRPFAHWSDIPSAHSHLIVAPDILTFFALCRARPEEDTFPFVLVTPVTEGIPPPDWLHPSYWNFASVTLLSDGAASPPPILNALADGNHPHVKVATAQDGVSWLTAASKLRPLDSAALAKIEAGACPASEFRSIRLRKAGDLEALQRACRSPDRQGRLCRMVRVAAPDSATLSERTLLIRSDRSYADIQSAPGRLWNPQFTGKAACNDWAAWSTASVLAFLDGKPPSSPELLGRSLLRMLSRSTGLSKRSASILAAYVGLTYVSFAFECLPVLILQGGTWEGRFAVRQLLAALCRDSVVASRTRSAQLARIADVSGGTMILDEPGPAVVPGGSTELGRFLGDGCVRNASSYNRVLNAGLRRLDVFGPKIVIANRFFTLGLAAPAVTIDLPDRHPTSEIMQDASLHALRDDLHAWAMSNVGLLGNAEAHLRPDRLLAELKRHFGFDANFSGEQPQIQEQPQADLPVPVPAECNSTQLMEEVLASCATGSYLAMVQVMLEVALRNSDDPSLSPERIGRWLASHPRIDKDRSCERRRLYGQISRIYSLADSEGSTDAPASAFDFCRKTACFGCRYRTVCGSVFPELKQRKAQLG